MIEKMGFETNILPENHPYGHARGETVEINGRSVYFKSQVEVRFAGILQRLKEIGAIIDWQYEPKDFWFNDIRRGTCSYRPDFHAVWANPDYGEQWYECKSTNGLRQKDLTKFKRMAKRYPEIKLVLVLPHEPSTGSSKSAIRQRILIDKAAKYLDHVTYLTDWKVILWDS